MKNNSARFGCACLAAGLGSVLLGGCSQRETPEGAPAAVAVIPAPAAVQLRDGTFTVDATTRVEFAAPGEIERTARYFVDLLARTRGLALTLVAAPGPGTNQVIRFEHSAAEGLSGEEGYSLRVSPQRIVVSARGPRGLFYGAITLWQLLTAEPANADAIVVRAVSIDDAPRFRWRGLMLDVARHYMPPQFIRQLLDWMALHKLNTFHWHLTDDQGWRLQIRKYPRLTEVGAWRTPAGAAGRDANGAAVPFGGFYTQEEVRDIVRYAAERHITVVPEIEMPGHAQAAIAAYPRLGVDGGTPPVSADWGVHTYLFNVDEDTFRFLEDVLTEVIDLFPGPYVHVGGDEAAKDRWESSPRVQARMRELGVASEAELQSYFIRRIERFLGAHGRRLIGWDEILEGGLAPNATVMSWRGATGGIEAAHQGHDVVMAPAPVLYLDHLQSDALDEPPGRPDLVTLADVYAFEPVPKEIAAADAHHVLGAQVNAWTEHMRTAARIEHAVFPRLAALAEVTWSPLERRDFDAFLVRLGPQLARYQKLGIRYAASALEPNARAARASEAQPRRKRDEELKLCSNKLALHLEDDAPRDGERAVFLVDIMDACWIYERAPLDGAQRIAVTVGQLPFNFQLWKDAQGVVTRAAKSPSGDLEIRRDRCDGALLASLSLASARKSDVLTTLEAPIAAQTGAHDLCLTFAAGGPDPLWVIDAVELL